MSVYHDAIRHARCIGGGRYWRVQAVPTVRDVLEKPIGLLLKPFRTLTERVVVARIVNEAVRPDELEVVLELPFGLVLLLLDLSKHGLEIHRFFDYCNRCKPWQACSDHLAYHYSSPGSPTLRLV